MRRMTRFRDSHPSVPAPASFGKPLIRQVFSAGGGDAHA